MLETRRMAAEDPPPVVDIEKRGVGCPDEVALRRDLCFERVSASPAGDEAEAGELALRLFELLLGGTPRLGCRHSLLLQEAQPRPELVGWLRALDLGACLVLW